MAAGDGHPADCEAARLATRCEEGLIAIEDLISAGNSDTAELLRDILLQAAAVLEFDRASIVLVSSASEQAFVVAATDDPTMTKFPVDVGVYPELGAAMDAGDVLVIEDVATHPLLAGRADTLRAHDVLSSAVFPIEWRGKICGAVFFRSGGTSAQPVGQRQLAFGRIVSGIVAHLVGGGQLLESLRDQTKRISLARYESERRLRAIEQLQSYFDAGADGVVVVDGDGTVLFVNRAAEAITGFARDGLIGRPLSDLVAEEQREWLQQVIESVLARANLEAFDLKLATTSEPIAVSVSTSTVLADHGAAILSFRDVTAERALEAELRSTKEFLEKLIGSTVDAIIAADLAGNIILFNPGAERLFGWRAFEVIGHISVERLYPDGVARKIMRMLRSASYGGVGRLEQTQREIVTRDGTLVPVSMTASVIYEDGREVATVGVLSDLRDRIRIEERLHQAQEKLRLTEKQAVVVELAGAAAHELNQPLTSVLLALEMIRRRMRTDDTNWRSVDTVLQEATRMAEIVKKIGQITRYETKEYVGSASILDLDKAANVGREPGPAGTTGGGR